MRWIGLHRQQALSLVSYTAFVAAYTALGVLVAAPAFGQPTAAKKKSTPTATSQPVAPSSSPLIAVVSIGRQRVTIHDKAGVVAQSPISSGRSGFETPQGVFSIIEKKEEHFSNIYDDAEMPFMQRITWSGVALHAGNLPGYPASHGCIRLPYSFAQRLFGMTRINTRVVVVPGETVPMSFAHPALFQPKLAETQPEEPQAQPPTSLTPPASPIPRAADPAEAPMMLGARLMKPLAPLAEPTSGLPVVKAVVTPLEAARAERAATVERATATAKAADAARLAHKAKLTEVAKAQRAVFTTQASERQLDQRAKLLERQIALARTEEQIEKAREAHTRALEAAAAATLAATEAKSALPLRQEEARQAADAIKAADKARAEAQAAAAAAHRLTDPISVFVSRKTGRVYLRQGRHPVADLPVQIADPQRPIGTLVFTAMESTKGGHGLNWNVVIVEAPNQAPQSQPAKGKGANQSAQARPAAPDTRLATAALDRISFPPQALARITPYVQPGSSLVVSDLGPSVETGQGTDFVVLTKGEAEAIASQIKWAKERALEKAQQRTASRRWN